MAKAFTALAVLLMLLSLPAHAAKTHPRRPTRIATEASQPGSPFDCDTARGASWFGSTARCLEELCRGRNVTNASVVGADGRLRANPCAQGFDDRR